ncbi:hypothetical protein RIF29_05982 [Crotalaria pallida]|uniref:UBC core domain-containing protein n=1 Tax=Crotalaria pallida TaxID=3830 RepID=A0AAN9PA28_CROPI
MSGYGGVARGRLAAERKSRRQNRPYGFVAKPETGPDGSVNLMRWKCFIPGKAGTDWEGGHYPLTLVFSEDYPNIPPSCKFPCGFLHPNVSDYSGRVCLSIIDNDWTPAITVKQILVGIQNLLDDPNPNSPKNGGFSNIFVKDRDEYKRKVRLQAKQYPLSV